MAAQAIASAMQVVVVDHDRSSGSYFDRLTFDGVTSTPLAEREIREFVTRSTVPYDVEGWSFGFAE